MMKRPLSFFNKVIDYYRENGKKHERIGKLIDRIGLDAFKNDVLAGFTPAAG